MVRRKREAEAAEDARRGALVRDYLAGAHGPELRRTLSAIVAAKDHALFGIAAAPDSAAGPISPTGASRGGG